MADALAAPGLRPTPRLLALGCLAFTFAASLFLAYTTASDERIFTVLLNVHDVPAGFAMAAALLACLAWRPPRDFAESLAGSFARYPVGWSLATFVLLCVGTLLVYRNHPLSMDEYAAWFQARVFAEGHLAGRFPADLLDQIIFPAFQNQFLAVNRSSGEAASIYWPGFALLLTPFTTLGIPWACNPALVALSLWLIGRLARDLLGTPRLQGWAMLLALASPAFTLNGMTYYSMPAHLALNLLFAWLLLKPEPRRVFLAGLVGGWALCLHNPFPHLLFALPWIAWLLVARPERWRNLALLTGGYLPMVLLLGAGWMLWLSILRGSAAAPAGTAGSTEWPALVGTLARGLLAPFTWPDEKILFARAAGIVKLWLWAAPFVPLLALFGAGRDAPAGLKLFLASALLTLGGYFFIPFDQGHGWGYRYFHSAWGALPLLAASALARMEGQQGTAPGGGWWRLAGIGALAGLLPLTCLRVWQMQVFLGMHLAQMPPSNPGAREVAFHSLQAYYAHDLIQNDPWLRGPRLVLISKGRDGDRQLMARCFPTHRPPRENRYGESFEVPDSLTASPCLAPARRAQPPARD